VLRQLPDVSDPDLLVGPGTGDDAAVYRLNDELALVQTVDFFPPIVDDPYAFGQIAVSNSLSDVYAMGGRPLTALNIVGFPAALPKSVLGEILSGGSHKAQEAGVLIVGGHTVDDKEPKYGMAVTGVIEPGRQVTNAGARPGDSLVLTKPIGTGVITTAGKQQRVDEGLLDRAVETMAELNRAAAGAMMAVGVNACSDVTGFGLLGHLRAMTRASNVTAEVSAGAVPVFDGVRELLEEGIAPGGTRRNLSSLDGAVRWDEGIDETTRLLLSDAQTSGGLLIAVAAGKRDRLLRALKAEGVAVRAVVGRVEDAGALDGCSIAVTP
jgi:selenide,water dikinase